MLDVAVVKEPNDLLSGRIEIDFLCPKLGTMDYFHSLISKLLWSRALSFVMYRFGCLSFLALDIGFAGKVLFAPTYLGHSVLPNEANGPVFAMEEENPQVDLTLLYALASLSKLKRKLNSKSCLSLFFFAFVRR